MRILALNNTSRQLIVSELTETVLICHPVIFIVIISRTFIWKAQLAISKEWLFNTVQELPRTKTSLSLSLSLDENVRAKEGGKEKTFFNYLRIYMEVRTGVTGKCYRKQGSRAVHF